MSVEEQSQPTTSSRPRARAVMVLGCTSGAGKSWLATALCRWYARQGLRVAPFKAQNMSNHARVVQSDEHGVGEIGSAQYFQARAAGVEPEVRFNPILLKPEADTRSQVVVMGQVRPDLRDVPWRERSALLWDLAQDAYHSLARDYDVVVIEGAGSPAEINLAASDYVNTKTALLAQAACLLVSDIDRGGSFAHLYGTHQLMDPGVRTLVRGFVLNRFRGDASLLAPGPAMLEDLTGVPVVGVVPMVFEHGLPEEDAVPTSSLPTGKRRLVVLTAPHASNLDELEAVRQAGGQVEFSHDPKVLAQADVLILPGSKQTRADLAWVRERGLDTIIFDHASSGQPVLAICGGLQMAGALLCDPLGLEGSLETTAPQESQPGLGLLALSTHFAPSKVLSRTTARFGATHGCWAFLADQQLQGYEIHLGETSISPDPHANILEVLQTETGKPGLERVVGWQQGSVLGVYLHGLLENPMVIEALTGQTPPSHDAVYDRLADVVEQGFGRETLLGLLRDV